MRTDSSCDTALLHGLHELTAVLLAPSPRRLSSCLEGRGEGCPCCQVRRNKHPFCACALIRERATQQWWTSHYLLSPCAILFGNRRKAAAAAAAAAAPAAAVSAPAAAPAPAPAAKVEDLATKVAADKAAAAAAKAAAAEAKAAADKAAAEKAAAAKAAAAEKAAAAKAAAAEKAAADQAAAAQAAAEKKCACHSPGLHLVLLSELTSVREEYRHCL